ncbi:MAG TPA: hypothetical protein VF894_00035 [Anaeromyxobacter sp.]
MDAYGGAGFDAMLPVTSRPNESEGRSITVPSSCNRASEVPVRFGPTTS